MSIHTIYVVPVQYMYDMYLHGIIPRLLHALSDCTIVKSQVPSLFLSGAAVLCTLYARCEMCATDMTEKER